MQQAILQPTALCSGHGVELLPMVCADIHVMNCSMIT